MSAVVIAVNCAVVKLLTAVVVVVVGVVVVADVGVEAVFVPAGAPSRTLT
jgi:3D (Asp-Asp-Asp) domain-containing protein